MTKGKILVIIGETFETDGKTLVTKGKALVTEGRPWFCKENMRAKPHSSPQGLELKGP